MFTPPANPTAYFAGCSIHKQGPIAKEVDGSKAIDGGDDAVAGEKSNVLLHADRVAGTLELADMSDRTLKNLNEDALMFDKILCKGHEVGGGARDKLPSTVKGVKVLKSLSSDAHIS